MRYILTILILISGASLFGLNNAIFLDGDNDFIEVNSLTNQLDNLNSYTIECWFKCTEIIDDLQTIFAINGSVENPNDNTLILGIHYKTLKLYDGNTGYKASTIIEAGIWYHVAFTKSNDGTAVMYLNGIEEKTGNILSDIPSGYTFSIGQEWDNNPSAFYGGLIDDFRVWNEALSESEIRQNMYNEISTDTANLIANITFNNNLMDSTSNSNNGAFMGGTAIYQTSTAIYGPHNCLHLGGNIQDTYVDCGELFNPADLNALTFECWIKPESDSGSYHRRIVTQGSLTWLALSKTGVLYTNFPDNSTITHSDFTLQRGVWSHVAIVWDGSTLAFYINGVRDSSINPMNSLAPSSDAIFLGYEIDIDLCHFWGNIDEVRIWNIARTGDELRQNMYNYMNTNFSELEAYYTFDNTSGTTLQDFSGNSNDASIINEYTWTTSTAYNIWLETSDDSWDSENNWTNGSPLADSNVAITNSSNEPEIPLSQTFNNLYIGPNVSTSLNGDITVNGTLSLDSNLNFNGNTITLGSSAQLNESSGYLNGSSGRIKTSRILSDINSNIADLGCTIIEDGNLGTTTISRGHTPQGANGIKRYYQITSEFPPSGATLIFHYLDSELNGQNETSLSLYKSSDGINWQEQASSLDTSENTLTLTGINSFSYWTAAPAGQEQTLPVTLSSFTASYIDQHAKLSWTTQSESNQLGWNIYRSKNIHPDQHIRINSEPILSENNCSQPTNYIYYDEFLTEESNEYFYWIESISLTNDSNFFGPISLYIEASQEEESTPEFPQEFGLFANYPNPFNPSTSISFQVKKNTHCNLVIFDVKGRKIKTIYSGDVIANKLNTVVWDGKDNNNNDVSSGVYFYQLSGKGVEQTRKMILVK